MYNNYNMTYALITGASGGLGYEFAKIFAKNKYQLILVARTQEKLLKIQKELQEKYQIDVKTISADLSQLSVLQKIYDQLRKEKIFIEILVNNAGFATYGKFQEIDTQTQIEEINLNVIALTTLTKLFLPEMIKKNKGMILNIASTAAFLPGPLMAVYYATKAYVLSFSQAVNNELAGTGVTITTLCPGPTKTGFEKRAHMENSKLFKANTMDAYAVAQAGFDGLMQRKSVVIPGFRNWILAKSVKFVPTNLVMKIVKQIQGKLA